MQALSSHLQVHSERRITSLRIRMRNNEDKEEVEVVMESG